MRYISSNMDIFSRPFQALDLESTLFVLTFFIQNCMGFLSDDVTMSVFELEKCSLHINGVEFDKEFNGNQIAPLILLGVGIPTKHEQGEKERITP